MHINFDPTIDIGTLISIGTVLVAAWKLSGKIAIVEFKVNELWRWKRELSSDEES